MNRCNPHPALSRRERGSIHLFEVYAIPSPSALRERERERARVSKNARLSTKANLMFF